MDYDEKGFVTVQIQDRYITDSVQTTQFLATGKDHAAEYFKKIRSTASNYNNHGLTDDQLIGMIQTVENPNDLQIMNNIATSNREFNANGKNAFDIDYWEDTPESGMYYSRGVSNGFSISLGQMGANMLQTGNDYDYRMYSKAAIETSINGSKHNILIDIASGAGLYTDACSLKVIDDPIGGDNDQALKETLNAANANYGAFAQMCGVFDSHPALGHHVKFTNIDIHDIDYDADTGHIYFNITCDKKTTGALVANSDEKCVDIGIKSDLEYGKLATNSKMTNAEETLKKELDKKRNEIVVDCLIDLAGEVNPYLKQGLTIAKDFSTGSDDTLTDSADMIKSGIKSTFKSDGFDTGASCTLTVVGAFKKYDDAVKAYEKAKKDCEDNKKLQTFYSYNTGSHTVGLYDYECIRKVQNWNENGISEVVGDSGKSNDDIYNSLVDNNGYRKDVVRIVGEELCNDEHAMDYLEKDGSGRVERAYADIKDKTGYTEEDIDNAMSVAIYGYSEKGKYHTVTDVPCDLMNACLKAISEEDGADVNVYRYWEDFTDEIG